MTCLPSFAEMQELAQRGGFSPYLNTTLEHEAEVLRKIRSKHGIRLTNNIKTDCLQAAQYSIEAEVNRCMVDPEFDPVRVFELRFYAECYALARLLQQQLKREA